MTTTFFKIIFSTEPKLRLPQKFVKENENSLPRKVSLEAPYGPSWKIELVRCKGEIFIDKGFEQFMEYYSIKLGHLLLFRYYFEELCFRVVILDTSASEIDYPVTNADKIIPKQVPTECCPLKEPSKVLADMAGVLLDDRGICGRQKVGKRERVEEDGGDASIEILGESPSRTKVEGGDMKGEGSVGKLSEFRKAGNRRRAIDSDNLRIEEERAEGIDEDVSNDASIEILEEFPWRMKVEKGDTKGEGSVEVLSGLRKAKKRRWANETENLRIEEKMAIRKEDPSRNRKSERIRKTGMKCETSEPDVLPSWAKGKTKYDGSVEHNLLSNSKTVNRLYKRAKAFVTRNPSFITVMRHSHIAGYLTIKKAFVEEFLRGQDICDVVLCIPDCKRTWTTKCSYGSYNTRLYWRQFVKDNGLCFGDVCVFELGNDAKLSLNVSIFRNNKNVE